MTGRRSRCTAARVTRYLVSYKTPAGAREICRSWPATGGVLPSTEVVVGLQLSGALTPKKQGLGIISGGLVPAEWEGAGFVDGS